MAPKPQPPPAHGRRNLMTNARPKPPQIHRRGQSSNALQTVNSFTSTGKSLLGGSKKAYTEIVDDTDEEELGTASFLQFCATCEKQIASPGSNILYCSEACRTKDASTSLSYNPQASPPLGALCDRRSSAYLDNHCPDILPRRSPTVLRPVSMTLDFSSPLSEDNSISSLDDLDTDHFRLQHSSTSPFSALHQRPKPVRTSSTVDGIPSLSHTPSSSVGTVASLHSNLPYLAHRHDITISKQHHRQRKSVDLVIPYFPRQPDHSHHHSNSDDDHEVAHMIPSRSSFLSHHQGSLKSSVSTMTSLHVAEAEPNDVQRAEETAQRADSTSAATGTHARAQGSLQALARGRSSS